ncbi:serine acetyltransferase [Chitinophagaceae bacterium LB-8]|jgi:serine O-acetyltransferase|uniref:Serine acetyltransferase n=1 Tax=Paraflavisolibacter caeni TaxID=2982496 RepID=A0A9X3BJ03_9BACT|nr:serine O-acetyltransferase EpsC [Paraflavisolibacter caeni]MCU7552157.1 serine acetyltransferase [Paraflavisolibacter caeni]
MEKKFLLHIFDKQKQIEATPSNEDIATWALQVISLLFPEVSMNRFFSVEEMESEWQKLKDDLGTILNATSACKEQDKKHIAEAFFEELPRICKILNTDINATLNGDPAARSEFEVIRAYPAFYALSFYRMAHALQKLDVPLIPRILTEWAHSKTGIDIHPGAEIGEYFHIDHGTGIVIGETTKIGKHVKLFQGVTLGALSVDKSLAFTKRHPTVEDHVIIYSNATILGGKTVIGHHSVVGGNVWLTKSVPPGSMVYHNSEITIVEGKILFD